MSDPESKRALRRHHRARMIARARRVTRRWYGTWEPRQSEWVKGKGSVFKRRPIDHTSADQYAVKVGDYLAVCSCYSCGNPRRHFGASLYSWRAQVLTPQERRSALYLREWPDDLEEVPR